MSTPRKLLVIQAAGFGFDFLSRRGLTQLAGRRIQPLEPVFPALTCPAQATFRTASLPSAHTITANGFYSRVLRRSFFWEQSATLVRGDRIWRKFRGAGRRVALLFWQQSLGEDVDMVLSPAPIHRHHGGILDACYSKPASLYAALCRAVGRKFRLARYWGPFASAASSAWIADATRALLAMPRVAPDLCLTYLPALDYDLQRFGPDHPAAGRALEALRAQVAALVATAEQQKYEWILFGDYAIAPCPGGPVFLNRLLREHGLLVTRDVRGRLYPDFHETRAFALADHEIAHVYVRDASDISRVEALFHATPGAGTVWGPAEMERGGFRTPYAGDLFVVAHDGHWFAYPWWTASRQAPEYARHVDIHNKPGYDPCELFHGWPPGSVSTDPARIRGSHGKTGSGRNAGWTSSFLRATPQSLCDLAGEVNRWLDEQ